MSSLYLKERLPHHLYYEFIIPYLFAQHLHQLIVDNTVQEWNPFMHLPVLSKEFHHSCQLLVRRIFDLDASTSGRNPVGPLDLLRSTRKLWQEARKLPLYKRPRKLTVPSTYESLMSSKSVIQTYICAGYAKYFYTVDVLNWICLDRLWITADDDTIASQGFQVRQFNIVEEKMHRLFLPFQCAMKLCDLVQDDILAGPIADYLAKKAVTYGTEPILLKYVKDLEMFITQEIGLPSDLRNKLTKDTLGLIDHICHHLVRHNIMSDLQESGELVSKYRRPTQISKGSIRNTRILDTLDATALADWEEDTDEIREYAGVITDDLEMILESTGGESEEHDEYFVQDGERILFSQI